MAGLTQPELSELSGVDQGSISLYENEKHLPSLVAILRLAISLNVNTDFLLGTEELRSFEQLQSINRSKEQSQNDTSDSCEESSSETI